MTTEAIIMQNKLNERLTRSTRDMETTLKHIAEFGSLLNDFVVPTGRMVYATAQRGGQTRIVAGWHEAEGLTRAAVVHDNAMRQMADRYGVPTAYLKRLISDGEWSKHLATEILNTHTTNRKPGERALLRAVDTPGGGMELRGFLSDRYRRLNSGAIYTMFLTAAQKAGAHLVDAHHGDTRDYLEVIHPEIIDFETPLNGRQYFAFGARLRNSEFGHGALELRTFMLSVACMNGMVGERVMHEVHLGAPIEMDIQLSEETILKETEARALFVRDAMSQIYLPMNRQIQVAKLQGLSREQVDITTEIERLPKLGLNQTETNNLVELLFANRPDDNLMGAPTRFKMLQGVTALARDAEPERRRELEKIACVDAGLCN